MAEKRRGSRKGEEGYWERNTDGAHAAHDKSARSHCTYQTAGEFEKVAEAYFARCDAENRLYGEAGLALALNVKLGTLRNWYDGTKAPHLQDAAQMAYLRIQSQLESDPRYQEKGMVTKAIFWNKQDRFGGYSDNARSKQEVTGKIIFGKNMDASDLE